MGLFDKFLGLSPGVQGGIISAGGGLISGLLGARESSANRESNEQIAAQNAASATANRDQIIQLLTAPSTDARGNRTSFDPATGFSVDLTPQSQDIINASDTEELRRLTEDANIRRRGLRANELSRTADRGTSEFFRQRLTQPSTTSSDSIRDLLLKRSTGAINRGFDDATSAVLRQAQRSGSNAGGILADFAGRRGEALGENEANAVIQSLLASNEINNANTSLNANTAAAFGDRAANIDNIAFNPSSIPGQLQQTSAQIRGTSPQLSGTIGAGALPQQQPNFGTALAVGGGIDALGGVFEAAQADRNFSQLLEVLANRNLGNQRTSV